MKQRSVTNKLKCTSKDGMEEPKMCAMENVWNRKTGNSHLLFGFAHIADWSE